MAIKRIISLEEVEQHEGYSELAELARIFNHKIVEDNRGVWRWKRNILMDHLQEGRLNELWLKMYRGEIPVEEMVKLNMQIGYSLSGFIDLFGSRESHEFKLAGAKVPHETSDELTQTVIEYMVDKYRGQVLKL